ncbi:MAG: phosphonate metabolism transcriptional regulator PhnF [Synechococcales bacterium]|nr:phosphonate metabolism transcriptional regulator PhnF [Synechococcales bacterium]
MSIYAQIAEELRRDIRQGIYQPGDKLPTEMQLSERFGVNRHTLRQAIALLKSEGLVRVEQGRGTFVTSTPIRYAIGKRVRYNEALKAHGRSALSRFTRAIEVPASPAVAKSLNLQPGQSVALIERLALANHEPISISTAYFPLGRFPNFLAPAHLELLRDLGSISTFLRQIYDCDHIRWRTSVSARLVKPADARLLEVPLNQPILLAESLNVDQYGTLIEYGVTRFRGDRMELVFENDLRE